jgi:cell wall-associated NlpC family hydrolase
MAAMPPRRFLLFAAALFLAGCAGAPRQPASAEPQALGVRAAANALKLVGAPYRYGGASPSRGFDCSGLVQYAYRQAGVNLPHNTDQQRLRAKPIRRTELRRGDLVFFDEEGRKHGHVGLYVGGGLFVHAPSSGKSVRRDSLDAPYWRKHVTDYRRVAA